MSLTRVFSLSPFKMALEDTCRMVALCALIFFSVFYSAHANEKTLVLIDNANTKETHSIFFNSLKGELTQNILALNLCRNQQTVSVSACNKTKGTFISSVSMKPRLNFLTSNVNRVPRQG